METKDNKEVAPGVYVFHPDYCTVAVVKADGTLETTPEWSPDTKISNCYRNFSAAGFNSLVVCVEYPDGSQGEYRGVNAEEASTLMSILGEGAIMQDPDKSELDGSKLKIVGAIQC